MPNCWCRYFRNPNGADGKGLNTPLWEKLYTSPYLKAFLLRLPERLTEALLLFTKRTEDDIDFMKDDLFRGAKIYEHDPAAFAILNI